MRLIKTILSIIIIDFFFFSTTFSFSGGINTKMVLAVIGLLFLAYDMVRERGISLPRQFLIIIGYSLVISLFAVISTTYNNTTDRFYSTYFLSMLTWLIGAYGTLRLLLSVNGKLDLELMAKYIVLICIIQGLMAVIQDLYLPLKVFINSLVPATWVEEHGRLYGLGTTTCLDTGGIRYAMGCIFSAYLITNTSKKGEGWQVPLYISAFILITITGNMVARTTIVGSLLGLAYMLVGANAFSKNLSYAQIRIWAWAVLLVSLYVVGIIALYNSSPILHQHLRFGFEGFFNWVEDGYWHTGSNDTLASMYVFPDNLKTWLIGDGYFGTPDDDPNYLGASMSGYYMGTDVGYLRFIFYFGVFGLLVFSLFIIYCGKVCYKYYTECRLLVLAFIALHFAIWFKVATDCFFVFALLMSLEYIETTVLNEQAENV